MMGRGKKNNKNKMYILIIVGILFGGIFLSTPYVGGWEIQSDIYNITANEQTYPVMLSGGRPTNTYLWGSKGIRFDIDDPMSGTGDVDVSIGGPAEKTMDMVTGEWRNTVGGEVYMTYQKNIGDIHYFWDHHVFMFDVQIVVTPDFTDYYIGQTVPGDTLPSAVQRTLGEGENMEGGLENIINLKINFKTDPWVNAILEQITDEDSNYLLVEESIWTGIMSAQIVSDGVESKFIGWTATEDDLDPPNGKIDPFQSGGTQLTLFTDGDGTYVATSIDENNLPEDKPANMAPDEVQVELGCKMFGAWDREYGGTSDIFPAQITYTIRFDVLSTAGYQLIDGDLDDELDDKDYKKGAYTPMSDLFAALNDMFEGQLMPLLIIVVVIFALYFGVKLLTIIGAGQKAKRYGGR